MERYQLMSEINYAISDSAEIPLVHGADLSIQPAATILIIDDDPTARLALAAIIAQENYRLMFAASATEVCEHLDDIDPDVILCDRVMEDMSGDEFLRWLKSHPRWDLIPSIGVTGLDSPSARTELLHAGADSVLAKPCNGQELRAHIRAALRTRRKYEQLAMKQCLRFC